MVKHGEMLLADTRRKAALPTVSSGLVVERKLAMPSARLRLGWGLPLLPPLLVSRKHRDDTPDTRST